MSVAIRYLCVLAAVVLALCAGTSRADTVASLLGNFTINQFCGLTVAAGSVDVHYAVVFGQLPALRELHAADANGDGVTSQAERDAYIGTLAPLFAEGLELLVDGKRVPLHATHWTSSLPTETGGFSLRVDMDLSAPRAGDGATHTLRFNNTNYAGRMGWHEIVVTAASGIGIFDTDAYATSATGGMTEALQSLPAAGPLDERVVHLRAVVGGIPPGAVPLQPRQQSQLPVVRPGNARVSGLDALEGAWITRKTRELVDALAGPHLEPSVVIWTLLAALLLGSVHALSPGHGKTIVGAYLIGSRGTPRHAVFLGFTVTVTHTIGVFLLGFATLYASRFIVPERLFPILSMISSLLILGMGVLLLVQRGRAAARALGTAGPRSPLVFMPVDAVGKRAARLVTAPSHAIAGGFHAHGGGPMHSHMPPGAAGERVTWRSLLTLGISGGLVPCPSAMVLLLAAIALNKTAYGMLLVVVFSLGLAVTLTVVGLMFLYARNRFRRPGGVGRWTQLLPIASAGVITVVGAALCVGAWRSFG